MNLNRVLLLVIGLLTCLAGGASAANVIQDEGVGLSREEVEYLVKFWPAEMQQSAANDVGDRLELLNMALVNKKMAALAETIDPQANPDEYWKLVFTIRNMQRRYVVKNYIDNLDIPDMTALAKERYATQKDKYALVPEQRLSSHILLLCPPGECNRDARRAEAAAILEELDAGADFAELATRYSEDPGSKNDGGLFDRWLSMGEPQVAPHYLGALFEIEKAGQYSGIVDTRFGLHIIRADEIREAYYKPYEEVEEQIIATLRSEYIGLQAKQFDASFKISDKANIDGDAMEEIFAPYQAEQSAVELEEK